MRLIASWSGGKDSCLAYYEALMAEHKITSLLHFVSAEYKRSCFHGIEIELMKAQANLLGPPILIKETPASMEGYEEEFKKAVSLLKERYDIEGMVFGDVYLDEHKEWVERVCSELGIKPVQPLWGKASEEVVSRFIEYGFKATVVSCKADIMGKEFIGREVDKKLLQDLLNRNICPCGENGEFHTFVTEGPTLNGRIVITESKAVLKESFWKHWFLDIRKWEVQSYGKVRNHS